METKGGRRDDDALGEQKKVLLWWLLQTLGSTTPGHTQAMLLHTPGGVTGTQSHSSGTSQALGHTLGMTPKASALTTCAGRCQWTNVL